MASEHACSSTLLYTSIDGSDADAVHIQDRALHFGDGLFESIFVRLPEVNAPLMSLHMRRLRTGCKRLDIPFCETSIGRALDNALFQLTDRMKAVERGTFDAVSLKLIVTRGAGGHGYRPPSAELAQPCVAIVCRGVLRDKNREQQGVRLNVSPVKLALQPQLAGIKHLNRLEYVIAANRTPCDADEEVLLMDQNDHVIEALHHNVFAVFGTDIITPTLDNCGVNGVMKSWLQSEHQDELNESIQEGELTLEDLFTADELFICNALRGVVPVTQIGNTFYQVGAVTRKAQAAVAKVLWEAVDAKPHQSTG